MHNTVLQKSIAYSTKLNNAVNFPKQGSQHKQIMYPSGSRRLLPSSCWLYTYTSTIYFFLGKIYLLMPKGCLTLLHHFRDLAFSFHWWSRPETPALRVRYTIQAKETGPVSVAFTTQFYTCWERKLRRLNICH